MMKRALLLLALLACATFAAGRRELKITVGQEISQCMKVLKCNEKKAGGICGIYKVGKKSDDRAFYNRCEFACYNAEIGNWHIAYRFELSEACKKEWQKDGTFSEQCKKRCHPDK